MKQLYAGLAYNCFICSANGCLRNKSWRWQEKKEDKSDDRIYARVNSKLTSGFSILQLSPRDRETLAAAILDPPVANKDLLAAAKRFKERMGR